MATVTRVIIRHPQNYGEWHQGIPVVRGISSCDPFEVWDAASECSHGKVPAEDCPEGCFSDPVAASVSPIDQLGELQGKATKAAAKFADMVDGAEGQPATTAARRCTQRKRPTRTARAA
ncbi:MAG TPA: hypothetical protein VMR75_02770 [Candidatus Saccharimonadales bacterium]|nr:hypothetical protein [Candidatus Saccharimonadales bacterium]